MEARCLATRTAWAAAAAGPKLEQIMHNHGLQAKDPFCLAGGNE